MSLPFTPLVILGAARSGTNLLRDMLAALPGHGTWPCDEVGALWRLGNGGVPHDALTPAHARPEVSRAIRKGMERAWRRAGRPAVMVEKTCANALRPGFVRAVLPEARILHLVRDGRAVVPSAMARWHGEMEMPLLPYLMRKLREVPAAALPRQALRFAAARRRGPDGRLSRWGPWPEGFETHLGEPLDVICARQWTACVQTAARALESAPPKRCATLRYEEMLRDPVAALRVACALTGHAVPDERIARAAALVRPRPDARPPLRPEVESMIAPARALWAAA